MNSETRSPPLAVAIVSYQCRELLDACLASLEANGAVNGLPPDVWVVDNGSTDGTAELVRSTYPSVHFLQGDGNLGFSAANNLALREMGAPYALVLNPDTVIHPGTLAGMVELMEERTEVGMAGCRLIKPDGTLDHAAKRSFPTISGALGHFSGLGRRQRASPRLAQYRAPEVDEAGPIDAINGAFMLIRRTALDEVGLFDEGYWLYMEDLDLCYRFKEAGWVVWYEPRYTVTHVKAGSSGRYRRARQNRAFHYGMYRFYRKFYAPRRSPVVNAAVYAGIGAKLVASMTRSAVARTLGRA
jgi:GT2 family glycosyltransferase